MIFLLIAVCLGGAFLQMDLLVARAIGGSSGMIMDTGLTNSLAIISTSAAVQLLLMTFFANLMLIGFFIVFSLFFESAILMSFTSLSVIMGLHTYYMMASSFLIKIDPWYGKVADWCFTHHLSDIFALTVIKDLLSGKISLTSEQIFNPMLSIFGWTAVFYVLAIVIFSRKQILH
jgi:hypothetical protein